MISDPKTFDCNHRSDDDTYGCPTCCDHNDIDENERCCLDCGEDLTERMMCAAYDQYKAAKYERYE